MTVLGALAALLEQGSFGVVAVNIWAPEIHERTTYPAFGLARFEGLLADTFGDGPAASMELPRVQLTVKGDVGTHDATEAVARNARLFLADQAGVELDGTVIDFVRSTSGLMYLGKDASDRPMWTTGFEVVPNEANPE